MSMFCYQCEQTAKGEACTVSGVCGKTPETAKIQDLLVHVAKGISCAYAPLRKKGNICKDTDKYIIEALFTTVTNVNFDSEKLAGIIKKGVEIREKIKVKYTELGNKIEDLPEIVNFKYATDVVGLEKQGEEVSILVRKNKLGDDITGLQELLTYGLKGTAAYADHALVLGKIDEEVNGFFVDALEFLYKENPTVDELLGMNLKCGEVNLTVMGLLDEANTSKYGHPEPTEVRVEPIAGKAILVSGHDLKDLEELLIQTEGKGINIYTHGEMLPCLAYPGLKKFSHLVGNYGGAWQDQWKEFEAFPGSILMTTNCIQKPKPTYFDRIFTCGLVAWPGVKHIDNGDFTPVIEAALAAEGFKVDGPDKKITIGFAHNAVMSVAGTVIDAVKSGDIKHFFLIGGCDGAKPGRNYFTEFAEKVPEDCVILTLACGKYRFNKLDFGTIGGIPRLLDCGQCNDAYSAVQIAVALAGAFECDVNSLPLSFVLSWYEQKAVCILLTLLHLGIKDIRLGPALPAFVTPTVLGVLVDKFNIMPIGTPEADLKAILG